MARKSRQLEIQKFCNIQPKTVPQMVKFAMRRWGFRRETSEALVKDMIHCDMLRSKGEGKYGANYRK